MKTTPSEIVERVRRGGRALINQAEELGELTSPRLAAVKADGEKEMGTADKKHGRDLS